MKLPQPQTARLEMDPVSDMLLADLRHHLGKLYPPVEDPDLDGLVARLAAQLDGKRD